MARPSCSIRDSGRFRATRAPLLPLSYGAALSVSHHLRTLVHGRGGTHRASGKSCRNPAAPLSPSTVRDDVSFRWRAHRQVFRQEISLDAGLSFSFRSVREWRMRRTVLLLLPRISNFPVESRKISGSKLSSGCATTLQRTLISLLILAIWLCQEKISTVSAPSRNAVRSPTP